MMSFVLSLVTLLVGWVAGTVVSPQELEAMNSSEMFSSETLSDDTFSRMQGKSYKEGCTVSRGDLRYLRVVHHDGHGHVRRGEMVCHRDIADDLVSIFASLYAIGFPIERMSLIDDYDADDIRSMEANNSSGFNYRTVAGSKKLSAHSLGKAVDLNPLYNPYVRRRRDGSIDISPKSGKDYVSREGQSQYMIKAGDEVCRLFKKYGFVWGGDWKSVKDYQHFEKP